MSLYVKKKIFASKGLYGPTLFELKNYFEGKVKNIRSKDKGKNC